MEKKALIVGGNNGIGLAIGHSLIKKGYHVIVVDRDTSNNNYPSKDKVSFYKSNLLFFDSDLFEKLSNDSSIEILMITAGIGRVADVEFFHPSEIQNTLTINTLSVLKILRIFYERIKNEKPFYTGVMVSIAGHVSSPMFSVYAASKAANARFIESVNIELEIAGVPNRILDVSPGSIKGTRFNGGENNLSLMSDLTEQIIKRLLHSDTIYIPEYKEIFKNVIDNYHNDPHSYGIHSYQYKLQSGRVKNEKKVIIGYLSGTFDLFHIGHLNLLKRAKEHCDYLIVGVHDSGAWKGKETFIPLEERKQIVEACKYVDKVVDSCREDCDAWSLWHYSRLFVGSDYKGTERFHRYEEYFKDKGVEIIYFPYTQSTSSTQLRKAINRHLK